MHVRILLFVCVICVCVCVSMNIFSDLIRILIKSYIPGLIKFYSTLVQNLEQELKNSLVIKWNKILIAIRVIKLYTVSIFQK